MPEKGTGNSRIFPENKYKGILYEPHKKYIADEDLKLSDSKPSRSDKSSKRQRRSMSKKNKDSVFKRVSLSSPEKPKKRGSAGGSKVNVRSAPRAAQKSYSYNRTPRKPVSEGGLFSDKSLRNILIACIACAVFAFCSIPTAFAKPTTNIRLNDGGRKLEASTAALTVGEFLEDNKIVIGEDDLIETDLNSPIVENMEIIIRRGMPVTIQSGRNSTTVNMVAGTVRDALIKAGVTPGEYDEVYPSLDSYVRAGMIIDHIIVQTAQRVEYRDIPYEETEREDKDLEKGVTKIVQEGELGELELKFDQIYKNGVMTSEVLTEENVTKEPIDEITAVGTYVPPPPEPKVIKMSDIKKSNSANSSQGSSGGGGSSSGESAESGSSGNSEGSSGGAASENYETSAPEEGATGNSQVTVTVTAYCSACNSGNKTASGAYPSYGTVAASLSQFPMGTKLYIPGYGYGVVQDTGGFSAGTIDVYLGEREVCTCGSEWNTRAITIQVF